MPRNKQFGYIFTGSFTGNDEMHLAVAHELGHGQFVLKHTFDKDYKLPQGKTDNLMDYTRGARHIAKWQWDLMHDPGVVMRVFERDKDAMQQNMPEYFKQNIITPLGLGELTHEDAILIQNEKEQTVAFIIPDEKVFVWVNDGNFRGFFEEGSSKSYISYVADKYNRKRNPISWGISLAASDLGGFVLDLIDSPVETSKNLATGLWKIATLQFDIEKTWNRIINADLTDAAYIVSTITLAYLSGPKGAKTISAEDLPRFQETLAEYASKTAPKMSWTQLRAFFQQARQFEALISQHFMKLYPAEQGYHLVRQVYLKVDGVMSIADDLIFNTKNQKFILNETKYGASNTLRKNQKVLQDAIKQGKKVEVRSVKPLEINGKTIYSQKTEITISEIIRSNSIDGTITNNTVQSIWKKQ
jgi:hypothetical protein